MSHRRAGSTVTATVEIQAGEHIITAADPPPEDVQQILNAVHARASAHNLAQVELPVQPRL